MFSVSEDRRMVFVLVHDRRCLYVLNTYFEVPDIYGFHITGGFEMSVNNAIIGVPAFRATYGY
jgi:hypothetical protein